MLPRGGPRPARRKVVHGRLIRLKSPSRRSIARIRCPTVRHKEATAPAIFEIANPVERSGGLTGAESWTTGSIDFLYYTFSSPVLRGSYRKMAYANLYSRNYNSWKYYIGIFQTYIELESSLMVLRMIKGVKNIIGVLKTY